jgi:hypothetical protein
MSLFFTVHKTLEKHKRKELALKGIIIPLSEKGLEDFSLNT